MRKTRNKKHDIKHKQVRHRATKGNRPKTPKFRATVKPSLTDAEAQELLVF